MNKMDVFDDRLSLVARGILAILEHCDDVLFIFENCPDGDEVIRAGLQELKEFGYYSDKPPSEIDEITLNKLKITPEDMANEILKRCETLQKDGLYAITHVEKQILLTRINQSTFTKVDNFSPPIVLLYTLLTKKPSIRSLWQPKIQKTTRISLAKLIIQYLKLFQSSPTSRELGQMEFELTLNTPSVITRAMKLAIEGGLKGFTRDIRPYIAEVRQLDINASKVFWADKAKEKTQQESFRNTDNFGDLFKE